MSWDFCMLRVLSACWVRALPPEKTRKSFDHRQPPQRAVPKSLWIRTLSLSYSLPGIGYGLGIVGGAMNIADTYT